MTLLVRWREGHPAGKKIGGWWRWALPSLDGAAPSRLVDVSASVNLPLHHQDQRFSSGTGSPGWSQKKGRKTVVVVVVARLIFDIQLVETIVFTEARVVKTTEAATSVASNVATAMILSALLLLLLTGRRRLKHVMDILADSDETELVTFTMTLVNKVMASLSR